MTLPHTQSDSQLTLIIFGSTGSLAADYLLPALAALTQGQHLSVNFRIVCAGRRNFATAEYREFIVGKSKTLGQLPDDSAQAFWNLVEYLPGDSEDPSSLDKLRVGLDRIDDSATASERLFYCATSPSLYAPLMQQLAEHGLLSESSSRRIRVLVEKPFGYDQASATELNAALLTHLREDQLYRIDHYQGKEAVQNILVARFANSIFEPLWHKDGIDHIEISVLEDVRVGARAPYYDHSGALRDMIQNHLLQLLALTTMHEPRDFTPADLQQERLRILRSLQPLSSGDSLVRGQYRGYTDEVGESSETETYIAMKLELNDPRWRGVPIILRTGKALHRKVAEISIHFRELNRCIFRYCAGNVLTFRLQPDESVTLRVNGKTPGFNLDLHQDNLEFSYSQEFHDTKLPAAYERLLLDFIHGDQKLFISTDEINQAWVFVDSVRELFAHSPLHQYEPGAAGPDAAQDLLGPDQNWWTK